MTVLILHVKRKYFDEIKAGTKKEEYRLAKPYWLTRLSSRYLNSIVILKGYPSFHMLRSNNRIDFPWNGYEEKTITHPEFGKYPVDVYAIKLEA